ncbi:MAG: hypothetical protein QW680_06300 [Pyrobaculum sp.]|uniref:Uncharacterized protein n=1 Tax=Pyrobaculum aerophilum TaxID=13773 RepID=A0A371R309_9CREN|nr:hypothetical protein CGL51_07900 [Pyrobaculum aerophilum]RFA98179.1 hypothetical protein CGL52_07965 [Pyrobaculum aerophilum]
MSSEKVIKSLLKKIWKDHIAVINLLTITLTLLPGMICLYNFYVSQPYFRLLLCICFLVFINGGLAFGLVWLLNQRRVLLHSRGWASVAIFSLPVTVGVSAALFSHYALNVVKDIQSKLDVLGLTLLVLFVLILWIAAIIALPLIEAGVVGGSHVITVIGEFATSMGTTLWALDPHSPVAGTLMGSGLTLIAVGLQTYYAERQKRP